MRQRRWGGGSVATTARHVVVAMLLGGLVAAPAAADPRVWRFATVAPDGTAWAREIRLLGRDIEQAANGELRVKIHFGAAMGGENEMESALRHGQLDGAVSGGMLCSRAAPSLRVLRLLGLVRDRTEAIYLLERLWPKLQKEFRTHGYVSLGVALVGMDLLFSRVPLRTFADMQGGRYWIWDLDDVVQKQMAAMGVHLVPASLWDAAKLYDGHKVDGFSTVPGAAVAFQWSAQTKYATQLEYTALTGCVIVNERVFDELSPAARQAIAAAGAKMAQRFNDLTATQDESLFGGLFGRQGLIVERASARLRADFASAAEEVRRRVGPELVPPALLQEATQILTEYRAHR